MCPEDTIRWGKWLGRRLRKGSVLCLSGKLGCGKTTFTKGLASGMGIRVDSSEVVSPTFVLIKTYPCRVALHHIDLYRLDRVGPVDESLIMECMGKEVVTVLEWGEKARQLLPSCFLLVEFRHMKGSRRKIKFKPVGGFSWVKSPKII